MEKLELSIGVTLIGLRRRGFIGTRKKKRMRRRTKKKKNNNNNNTNTTNNNNNNNTNTNNKRKMRRRRKRKKRKNKNSVSLYWIESLQITISSLVSSSFSRRCPLCLNLSPPLFLLLLLVFLLVILCTSLRKTKS